MDRRDFIRNAAAVVPGLTAIPLASCAAGEDLVQLSPAAAAKLGAAVPPAGFSGPRVDGYEVLDPSPLKLQPVPSKAEELLQRILETLQRVHDNQSEVARSVAAVRETTGTHLAAWQEQLSSQLMLGNQLSSTAAIRHLGYDYAEEQRLAAEEASWQAELQEQMETAVGPEFLPDYRTIELCDRIEVQRRFGELLRTVDADRVVKVLVHEPRYREGAFLINDTSLTTLQQLAHKLPEKFEGYAIVYRHDAHHMDRTDVLHTLTAARLTTLLNAAWRHDEPAIREFFDAGGEHPDVDPQNDRLAILIGADGLRAGAVGPFTTLHMSEPWLKEEHVRLAREREVERELRKLAEAMGKHYVSTGLLTDSKVMKVAYDALYDDVVIIWKNYFSRGEPSHGFVRHGGTLANVRRWLEPSQVMDEVMGTQGDLTTYAP